MLGRGRADAAGQHRPALDAELRRARAGRGRARCRAAIKVFAGQRDDPFFVDLGSVFDLAGLRPFNPAHVDPADADDGVDGVGGFNTHAIVLQVPITQLTRDGKRHAADDMKGVIGVYATASRQRTSHRRRTVGARSDGDWVQVSRLANPLINEVVIPLG